LLTRYTILPYIYTAFFKAHVNGTPVARPLLFEFPTDDNLLGLDTQFLIGSGFMVTPVLQEGASIVSAYFPNEFWYDYYSGASVRGIGYMTLSAPIETINLHIRGGTIVPIQDPSLTTTASRKNPLGLLVALGRTGQATGELFLDDGETLDTVENGQCTLIFFTASVSSDKQGTLVGSPMYVNYFSISPMNTIKIFGVTQTLPNPQVTLNGVTFSSWKYNSNTQVLTLNNIGLSLLESFTIVWTF